jgi:hypothetical protein
MRISKRRKPTPWISAAILATVLWAATVSAQFRAGSLEFAYTTPPYPVGVVSFNYTSDGKPPYITYEIPVSHDGSFTAPWLLLTDEGGKIIGDTIILLTNPDSAATLSLDVMLRGRDGVLEPSCAKRIIVGPKMTVKRSTRVLFPSCPLLP